MLHRKCKATLQFLLSKRAISLPISFLMLFVSLTVIVSATYYVSVAKIQTRGKILNIAVAKQSMLSFENSIGLAKWSPGSLNVYHFEDSGGTFETHPAARNLLINVTDNNTFFDVVFNSSIGDAAIRRPFWRSCLSPAIAWGTVAKTLCSWSRIVPSNGSNVQIMARPSFPRIPANRNERQRETRPHVATVQPLD